MGQCCWKNGADRPAPGRVATNLQCVKNVKYNKEICNKMRNTSTKLCDQIQFGEQARSFYKNEVSVLMEGQ